MRPSLPSFAFLPGEGFSWWLSYLERQKPAFVVFGVQNLIYVSRVVYAFYVHVDFRFCSKCREVLQEIRYFMEDIRVFNST